MNDKRKVLNSLHVKDITMLKKLHIAPEEI